MNHLNFDVLNNPIWYALQTIHKKFAFGTNTFQRYPSDILKFVGCENSDSAKLNEIEPWIYKDEKIFMVGKLPSIPSNWETSGKLDCVQMICVNEIILPIKNDSHIYQLDKNDQEEMFKLINLVQPGLYNYNTPLLGNYFGIKVNENLVSMAGERLCINGLTEISAVCTHPSFTGRGYAMQLVALVANNNIKEGSLPFLHLVNTNIRAAKIYELLGFSQRRTIEFSQLSCDHLK